MYADGRHPAQMMGEEGIEPSWYCYRRILNPVRLPVPPLAHHLYTINRVFKLYQFCEKIQRRLKLNLIWIYLNFFSSFYFAGKQLFGNLGF